MVPENDPKALGNLRIVDFSRVLAGPFATMMLGDLGAEVTKIERPETGDDTRAWGPPYDQSGAATYFQSVNRNKRSLVLDLTDPDDSARARDLASEADVLVENFRPGVMDRLGLGFDQLNAGNAGLVYCSITGFGSGGGASIPGYDLLVQALGGLMSITGEPGRQPQKVGVALVDVLAGLFASVGILAALRHRESSGEGQRVEINLLSSLLAALANQGAAFTGAGVVPERMGNAHPSIAPYEVFDTGEGHLVLAVGNDKQFKALCQIIDAQELLDDPRFAGNPDRVAHREELRELLERYLSRRSSRKWAEELMAGGVPAGVVNDIGAAFGLAEQLGLDPIVGIDQSDVEATVRVTRNPIKLSKTPATYRLPPPTLPSRE